MSKKCPVKSSKEWKDLVVYSGSEERAYAFYISNNYEIPLVNELKDKGIKPIIEKPVKVERFLPLIDKNIEEIGRLNKILARKKSDLKKSTNKPTLSKEIQTITAKIDSLEESNVTLKKKKALEDIKEYAENDLLGVRDIFDKYETKGINLNELRSTVKTIKLWQDAGDFSNDDHLFLTPEELEELDNPDNEIVQSIRNNFSQWKIDADRLYNRYRDIAKNLLENEVQKMFGDNVDVEVDKILKDVNSIFKNTIDISEVDHQLFQLMSQWVRKANFDAKNDVEDDFKEITELFDNLKKKRKLDDFITLLHQRQSNTDSRYTGDLTSRFTQLWHNKESNIYRKLKVSLGSSEDIIDPVKKRIKKQKAYKTFNDDINEISITLDNRKLFFDDEIYNDYKSVVNDELEDVDVDFNNEVREEYINELKNYLGEEGYNHYYNQLLSKLSKYKQDEKAQRDYLEDTFGDNNAIIEQSMSEWILKYNPFWNSHYNIDGYPNKKIGSSWASSSKQYISSIAKKYNDVGKDLGYYDDNYNKIVADDDMKSAYTYVTDVLYEYMQFLPPHETQFWHTNTLPNLEKSILETFTRDGMLSGLQSTWNSLKDATRTDVFTSSIPENINDKFVQLNFINDNSSIISDYITTQSIKYKIKHPNVTKEELQSNKDEWKKEILNKLSSKKSWDIEKITKAFLLHSSSYKHKAKIEDPMKVCRNMIDELIEQQTKHESEPSYNKTSRKLNWKTKDLTNIKDMADYFLDNFFGYKVKKVEGKTTKKILTSDEKVEIAEIEKTIESNINAYNDKKIPEDVFVNNNIKLQKQLDKVGGVKAWGNVADMLIKYFQVKGIGWNLFSAFANRGFGQIANWIESADGRRFSQAQLRRASSIMNNTILKNYTFDKYNPEITQKVRSLMNKLDVLKESKNEIFEQKLSNFSKKFKWLNPYNMQSRGEYLNQGEVMIGVMLNTKVILDGKESNLWDASNFDGSLKTGTSLIENSTSKTLDELVFKTKSKIDEAIRTLHGNYDYENAPLMIKKTVLGRMLAQFRTWAFMGFYDRFGSSKESEITGFEKKGRYLSYNALFKEFGVIQGTMELTKNLARKLVFQNTKFDNLIDNGEFSEADAANLRKNLQEIVIYMIITGLGLLLRAAVVDDDEKESPYRYLSTFWINQMGRLKTDILFYTNPVEFEKLQRQALPIFNLVQDSSRLLNHGFMLMTGQTNDFYNTGIYAKQRKSSRYIKNIFPFLNQLNKLESSVSQIR